MFYEKNLASHRKKKYNKTLDLFVRKFVAENEAFDELNKNIIFDWYYFYFNRM